MGDEAFPLKKNLMRPYSGRNLPPDKQTFNIKLTSARKLIENAFGILVSKFRIYHTTIIADPEVAISIIKSTVSLHNYIKKTKHQVYSFQESNFESSNLNDMGQASSNHSSNEAMHLRDVLKNYLFDRRN